MPCRLFEGAEGGSYYDVDKRAACESEKGEK
jgi:hypothetical protein